MNVTIKQSEIKMRWVALVVSFLLGILFASIVDAQQVGSNSSDTDSPNFEAEFAQLVVTRTSNGYENVLVQPQDEVWLISARDCDSCPQELSRLQISRLENGQWVCDSLQTLLNRHLLDQSRESLVFVHGNRYDLQWCQSRGLQFYKRVFACQPQRPAIRLILFCWRSETEKRIRILQDFRIKSQRSLVVAETLAILLNKFQARDLTLCSYSLGAQIVAKAIRDSAIESDCLRPFAEIVMIAPAFDADYSCCQLQGFSQSSSVRRTELFINQCDRVVAASELVARKRCRDGRSPISRLASLSGTGPNQICINDITDEIENKHGLNNYMRSATLQNSIRKMVVRVAAEQSANRATRPDVAPENSDHSE